MTKLAVESEIIYTKTQLGAMSTEQKCVQNGLLFPLKVRLVSATASARACAAIAGNTSTPCHTQLVGGNRQVSV